MKEFNKTKIKAAVTNLIVALIFIAIIIFTIKLTVGEKISRAISLANIFITNENEIKTQTENISLKSNNVLSAYPSYGEKYGTLKIESLNVNLSL